MSLPTLTTIITNLSRFRDTLGKLNKKPTIAEKASLVKKLTEEIDNLLLINIRPPSDLGSDLDSNNLVREDRVSVNDNQTNFSSTQANSVVSGRAVKPTVSFTYSGSTDANDRSKNEKPVVSHTPNKLTAPIIKARLNTKNRNSSESRDINKSGKPTASCTYTPNKVYGSLVRGPTVSFPKTIPKHIANTKHTNSKITLEADTGAGKPTVYSPSPGNKLEDKSELDENRKRGTDKPTAYSHPNSPTLYKNIKKTHNKQPRNKANTITSLTNTETDAGKPKAYSPPARNNVIGTPKIKKKRNRKDRKA